MSLRCRAKATTRTSKPAATMANSRARLCQIESKPCDLFRETWPFSGTMRMKNSDGEAGSKTACGADAQDGDIALIETKPVRNWRHQCSAQPKASKPLAAIQLPATRTAILVQPDAAAAVAAARAVTMKTTAVAPSAARVG